MRLMYPVLALSGFASLTTGQQVTRTQSTPAGIAAATGICADSVIDVTTGNCVQASSAATFGMLYPLSVDFYIDETTGRIGMGTASPESSLQIGHYFDGDDNYLDLRTRGGPGNEFSQGVKMRSSNPFFGFDVEHDDFLKGLNILRWDVDFGVFGDSALYIDRATGNLGLGTTSPNVELQIGTNSTPDDKYLAIRTAGGNQFKAGIKLSHFADDNGFIIESDETGPVNGLNILRQTGTAAESTLYISRVTGQVGLGTTAPSNNLHVRSTGPAVLRLEADTDNSNENDHAAVFFSQDNGLETGYVGFNNGNNEFKIQSATNDIDFDTGGTNRMRVTLGGNVGIGTTAPSQTLSVNGSAGKPGGGSWSSFSDLRLKKNVADLDDALETLLALRGVTFEYRDAASINELDGERIGFIAQEVEEVLPDWVDESGEYKTLTIRGFEALAVEAIREQQAEIDALRERISQLESLHAEMETLQAALANLQR